MEHTENHKIIQTVKKDKIRYNEKNFNTCTENFHLE